MTDFMQVATAINQGSSLNQEHQSTSKLDIYWIELLLKFCFFSPGRLMIHILKLEPKVGYHLFLLLLFV